MKLRRVVKTLTVIFLVSLISGASVFAEAAAYDVNRGPNRSQRVILTYDDCPDSFSDYREVLAYAKANNIGLAIFATGQCIDSFQSRYNVNIAELAREHGQYVGNHSYSHPNLTKLSYSGVVAQINRRVGSNYGRPPYGAVNSTVIRAYEDIGMRRWHWTVDTRDWEGKSQSQIINYVVSNARAGDTVLMHLQWNGFNPTTLGAIKWRLKAERNLDVCRAWHGTDGAGPVVRSPRDLPAQLPC